MNNVGAYECTNSKDSGPRPKVVGSGCLAGYKPTTNPAEPCADVNECNEQLHSCESSEKCVNEIGSYRCEPLYKVPVEEDGPSKEYKTRYEEYLYGGGTNNINEDQDVTIVEPTCLPGYTYNYTTERCDGEYSDYLFYLGKLLTRKYTKSNEKSFTDIDECLTDRNNCTKQYVRCINLPGSFRCDCKPGFELNITTYECQGKL